MDATYQTGMNYIKMKRFFLIVIFLFFSLVFVNFSSSIPYGSGIYEQETSCTISDTGASPAGTFSGGSVVIEKYIYRWGEILFEFNNITYTIKIEDIINNETAVIKISGGNKNWNFNLGINQTEKVDLNEDEIYDLSIYLRSISGDRIYITANSIQEEISGKETRGIPVLELLIIIIILLIIIVILLIVIIFRRKIGDKYRRRRKKTEYEIKKGKIRAKRHLIFKKGKLKKILTWIKKIFT